MYTPNNVDIFTAAFAGALGGMGASDRQPHDSTIPQTQLAIVAGAWAQAFDTGWGSTPIDELVYDAVYTESFAVWQSRGDAIRASTSPSAYAAIVGALIAQINASESYFATQGIVPPPWPPAGIAVTLFQLDTTITEGQAFVFTTAGHIAVADSAHLSPNVGIGGIAAQSGVIGSHIPGIVNGAIPASVLSLGAGFGCAAAVDASGNVVRATDLSNASGLVFVGTVNANGVVFVQPFRRDLINMLDFGADPTGVNPNDVQYRTVLHFIRTNVIRNSNVYFPGGDYRFNSWMWAPTGCTLHGNAQGTVILEGLIGSQPGDTRLIFYGPGPGILVNSDFNFGNGVEASRICDLTILGALTTGQSAPMTNTLPQVTNQGVGDGLSPIVSQLTVTGVAANPGPPSNGLWWIVRISTGGPFAGAQFVWSKDGGQTLNGPFPLSADFDTGTGVHLHFAPGNYQVFDIWTFDSCQNINECLIDDRMDSTVLERLRMGGFKYQISLDGSENTKCHVLNFDALDTFGGYQDMGTNFDATFAADSAFAIRVGSFKAVPGQVANGNYFDTIQWNNTRWGFYAQSGVGLSMTNANSELSGGFGIITGFENVSFSNFIGEGHSGPASIWVPTGGGPFNLSFINVLFPTATLTCLAIKVEAGASIGTFSLVNCEALLAATYPIGGAGTINGPLDIIGSFTTHAGGWIQQQHPASANERLAYNTAEQAQANFDIVNTSDAIPIIQMRAGGLSTIPFLWWQKGFQNGSGYEGPFESFDRVYSSQTNREGAEIHRSIARAYVVNGAAAANFGALTIYQDVSFGLFGAFIVTMTVFAIRQDDHTKQALWKMRQRYTMGVGPTSPVATAPVESFYVEDTDGGFVDPTIVVVGNTLKAQITGHATSTTFWAIQFEAQEIGF